MFSCLIVIDLAAKVHPAHVLNEDVQSVPLLSSDVHHQHSVSLQQTLENLFTRTHTSWVRIGISTRFCKQSLVFSLYLNGNIWLARQQKIIVKAYPIDGHICTVMNPIQWRDKWRGLGEVPGQRGPIQHKSIVLHTIDMTGCRHKQSRSSACFKRFTALVPPPLLWPSDLHHTCFISSNVRGCCDFTGSAGEMVFNRSLTLPTWERVEINYGNLWHLNTFFPFILVIGK